MKKNLDPRLQGNLGSPSSTVRRAYVSPRLEKLADVSGDTNGGGIQPCIVEDGYSTPMS